ncbi:MAG: guanylate kinase [bacterium]
MAVLPLYPVVVCFVSGFEFPLETKTVENLLLAPRQCEMEQRGKNSSQSRRRIFWQHWGSDRTLRGDGFRMGRLLILAGPSCAGKTPLRKCLARCHPEVSQTFGKVVLYNSRPPRIGEVDGHDYHFRTRTEVEQYLRDDKFLGMETRGDLQALDLETLRDNLAKGDFLHEGNTFMAHAMLTHPALDQFKTLSIFVSPLSGEEMQFIHGKETIEPRSFVAEVMRKKLLRRMRAYKGEMSKPDLEEVERRAGTAYDELRLARHFDHVIVNHDGEDSENWEAFHYPLGDARRAMFAFMALLKGESYPTEHWKTGSWT